MKISYISTSTIPSRAANSIHVMKMCQAFAKNGHEVLLIAPDKKVSNTLPVGSEIYEFYGVDECFRIAKIPWLNTRGSSLLYGLLSALKAKQYSSHLVYGRSLTGCYCSAIIGLPVFFESHQPVSGQGKSVIFKSLLKKKRLFKLVVISRALSNYYSNKYNIEDQKIVIAPDAADPPQKINPVRLTSSDRLQVGYIGHLYLGKGMEVIADLARNCSWADFHIVGGLENDINRWKSALEGLQNLTFHGFIAHRLVGGYLDSFDVLLAPYQEHVSGAGVRDTNIAQWMSPLKLFEYMSAGKPIICSDLPVLRELVSDGETAILCSPFEIEPWIKALTLLNQNRTLAMYLGNNARKEFLQKYTWDTRVKKLLNVINSEISTG